MRSLQLAMGNDRYTYACPHLRLMAQGPSNGFLASESKLLLWPLLTYCLWATHWPHCSSSSPNRLPPQGLCTCCFSNLAGCSLCICMTYSLTSCMSLPKGWLFRKALPDHPVPKSMSSFIRLYPTLFFSQHSLWVGPHIYFLCWLLCLCLY